MTAEHTATMRGYREKQHDQLRAYDKDLIVISSHGATCPLCEPWEAVVLSLSGRTPGYPSLQSAKAAGLFHDGCRHVSNLYTPGLTKPKKAKYDPVAYRDREIQQTMEQYIRHWKKRVMAATTDAEVKDCKVQLKSWQAAIRKHIDDANASGRKRHDEKWITLKRNSSNEKPTEAD